MVSAIQAVPNVDTANIVPNVGRSFQVVSGADISRPVPSTIVSLGATPALPLTFDATGLFGTAPGNIAATPAATNAAAVAAPAASAANSAINTPPTPANRIAVTPLTPAVADTTGVIPQDNGTVLANTVVDPAVQAQINIQTNPAYASLAAGLYLSVAIYRAQQRDLTDTTYSPQPTTPVSPVAALASSTQAGGSDSRWNRSGWAWH